MNQKRAPNDVHRPEEISASVTHYQASLDTAYLVGAMDVYSQQFRALLEMSNKPDFAATIQNGEAVQYVQHGTIEEWSEYASLSRYIRCAVEASLVQYEHQDASLPMQEFYRNNNTRLDCFISEIASLEDMLKDDVRVMPSVTKGVNGITAMSRVWQTRLHKDMGEHSSLVPLLLKRRFYDTSWDDTGSHNNPYRSCVDQPAYMDYANAEFFDPQMHCDALKRMPSVEDARLLYLKSSLRMAIAPHLWTTEDHVHAQDLLTKMQNTIDDSENGEMLNALAFRMEKVTPETFPSHAMNPDDLKESLVAHR